MFRRLLIRYLPSLRRHQEGVAAVEFALILLPLALFIGGVVDFGDAYYIKQVISSASREGARYGVQYAVNSSGTPVPRSASDISNYVIEKYHSLLPGDANLNVPPPTVDGNTLIVTVSADKHWFFFGELMGFPNPKTLTATTAMTLEH